MAYYTIKMNDDKTLTVTNRINLHQRESLIDKIRFIIPKTYGDYDLTEFTWYASYKDPTGVAHALSLKASETDYNESYSQYFIDIDNNLNLYVGDIEIYLEFVKNDYENEKIYAGKTSTATITILSVADYFNSVNADSLSFVSKAISELQAQVDLLANISTEYNNSKIDDLAIDDEGKLHGVANGKIVGDGVDVSLPGTVDNEDGTNDGIIDIDKLYEKIDI